MSVLTAPADFLCSLALLPCRRVRSYKYDCTEGSGIKYATLPSLLLAYTIVDTIMTFATKTFFEDETNKRVLVS